MTPDRLETAAALVVLAVTALAVHGLVRGRPRLRPALLGPSVAAATSLGIVAHGLRGGGAGRGLLLAGLALTFTVLTWIGHPRRHD